MLDDWFVDFIPEHLTRHPFAGLPSLESEEGVSLYAAWRSTFLHRGITDRDVATAASERLTGETIRYPREHFPRLCELAIEVYKTRQAAAGAGVETNSREAARLASRGCTHCGGEGQATAYHPKPDYAQRIPEAVAAHCVCPHGRWIRRRLGEQDPAVCRRVPDLAEVLAGRTPWQAEPAGLTPASIGFDPMAALKALVRHHMATGRNPVPVPRPARAPAAQADPTRAQLDAAAARKADQLARLGAVLSAPSDSEEA